jgi:hypothetical protein
MTLIIGQFDQKVRDKMKLKNKSSPFLRGTTFSRTTLDKMTLSTIDWYARYSSVVPLSAKSHSTECLSNDCHSDDCHSDECHSDECHSDECHSNDCHSDECHSYMRHSYECHSDECHSDERHSNECHSNDCHSDDCQFDECHSNKRHSAECHPKHHSTICQSADRHSAKCHNALVDFQSEIAKSLIDSLFTLSHIKFDTDLPILRLDFNFCFFVKLLNF